MPQFTRAQIAYLFDQHTHDTGQKFSDEAINYTFEQTQGQPWLVNALAYEACFRDITDRSQIITKDIIERAKETLIARRDTHLDVLIDRLEEPRVRNIMNVILQGEEGRDFPIDDVSYVMDIGLVTRDHDKNLVIANPIYQEVIPRELTHVTQLTMVQKTQWYIDPVTQKLDMHRLLEAFSQFYRENSDVWLEKFAYKESGPHLLLMAFLQRVINGGGKIHREYALGRKRVDLLVEYQSQRIVIELKIKRGDKTLVDGLKQTADYMDLNDANEGFLVIFDRSSDRNWDEKIFTQAHHEEKHMIEVWGM